MNPLLPINRTTCPCGRESCEGTHAAESGWLIETRGPMWYGESGSACRPWVADANLAVRFCRREDAERMKRLLGFASDKTVYVTEHQWIRL